MDSRGIRLFVIRRVGHVFLQLRAQPLLQESQSGFCRGREGGGKKVKEQVTSHSHEEHQEQQEPSCLLPITSYHPHLLAFSASSMRGGL